MKTALSVLALSGALLLTGITSSVQANPLTDPKANQYSWGVIVSPNDGPNRSYTAAELGMSGMPQARSVGQATTSRAAVVNDPHATQYSWGVIVSPNDGPNRSYSAEELGLSRTASGTQNRGMN